MINYGHGMIGYVLTMISLIHALTGFIVSTIVVVATIHHRYHHRLKREEKITLLLSAYIYSFLFIYTIILIATNIQTLLGDVYGTNYDTSWCIFREYWITVIACALYYTFVVQAIFRLCRIVYSNYRWLRSYWIFVISAPVQTILSILLVCPVLIWHDIVYLPNDYYCYVLLTNIRGMLWLIFTCYGVPLICLMIIYIRITLFIRQQSSNLMLSVKRRQQRDLLAIQRIFINVGLLVVLGLPGMTVVLMAFFTGVEYPLSQRILYIGVEISLAILSIEMIFMTPQLKNILIKRWQQNRVTAFVSSIP